MEKDIFKIIEEDKEAGYSSISFRGKFRGCETCAYSSSVHNLGKNDKSDWLPWINPDSAHNGLERWCSQSGQWMREEYWREKSNCPLYEGKNFKKPKRIIIGLKPIWKS